MGRPLSETHSVLVRIWLWLRFILCFQFSKSLLINNNPCRSRLDHHPPSRSAVVLRQVSPSSATRNDRQTDADAPSTTPRHPLGPPDYLRALSTGETTAVHRYDAFDRPRRVDVTRLSSGPDIFLLRNFVSDEEGRSIIRSASSRRPPGGTMVPAESADRLADARVNCRVCWMGPDDAGGVPGSLSHSAAELLLTDELRRARGAGCEDMQTVRYGSGGEFRLHHDGEPRVLTVIYYLNGVAGTWFPLAGCARGWERDGGGISAEPRTRIPRNRRSALDQIESTGKTPGRDGILLVDSQYRNDRRERSNIFIDPGDAVAFYNYRTGRYSQEEDSLAQIDWRAMHAGLPAKSEEKWIATHWFRGGDACPTKTIGCHSDEGQA